MPAILGLLKYLIPHRISIAASLTRRLGITPGLDLWNAIPRMIHGMPREMRKEFYRKVREMIDALEMLDSVPPDKKPYIKDIPKVPRPKGTPKEALERFIYRVELTVRNNINGFTDIRPIYIHSDVPLSAQELHNQAEKDYRRWNKTSTSDPSTSRILDSYLAYAGRYW